MEGNFQPGKNYPVGKIYSVDSSIWRQVFAQGSFGLRRSGANEWQAILCQPPGRCVRRFLRMSGYCPVWHGACEMSRTL